MTRSSGSLTYAANFDPYGNLLEPSQPGNVTNLGYTGAPTDPSGLIYQGSGFYNPAIAAALQSGSPKATDDYSVGAPSPTDSLVEALISQGENTNGFTSANVAAPTPVAPLDRSCDEGSLNLVGCFNRVVKTVNGVAAHPVAGLVIAANGWEYDWDETWQNGLAGWLAAEQKSDKDIGIWWNSGGSTQFIGIFFPEIYAINTLQEWGRGRQPQLSDALSFLPVAGDAGEAFDALGSLDQSESAIADVAANDATIADSIFSDGTLASREGAISSPNTGNPYYDRLVIDSNGDKIPEFTH